MTVTTLALLAVAGFGAGLVGYITGLASLVSYPALLLAGLSPLAANVTNTVALVSVGVGSTAQAGSALLDRRRRLAVLGAISIVGGLVGSVVLLASPEGSFETVVPFLVALASIAVLTQPALRRAAGHREMPTVFAVSLFAVSVYGGYFGAGAGVIFLALALVTSAQPLWRAALLKSALLGLSNLSAAVVFAATGPVHWVAAVAMGIGCLAGGWAGPPIVARLPAGPLRVTIGLAGLGLAVWLAVR
ncbi:sulfite exporter TauE/SafE family protein [Williamsia sp. SKLECPSW1]